MASHHPVTELDSGATDSVASTPRSVHHNIHDDNAAAVVPPSRVRFMCSFGGKILPRPHDNQLRYVGGDTRIVAINRHTTFSALLAKLSKLSGTTPISIKYQLPNEDLDSLITVTTDEDVENMMDEYDRLVQSQKSARLRFFLFATDADSRASSISSLLDGSTKREHWFLDALNSGSGRGPLLERGQSEVSSIVSEVPDYLFGLDTSDDGPREPKLRNSKNHLSENHPGSDPGSPNPVVSSPFCSTSSSLAPHSVPAIPDLPPVKTKPNNRVLVTEHGKEAPVEVAFEGTGGEAMVSQQTGYTSGPMWHYSGPAMPPVPVYYVPATVRSGNIQVQQVPIGAPYVQQIPVQPGQVPIGFNPPVSSLGQVYGGGARSIPAVDPVSGRVVTEAVNQAVYYGVRNVGTVPNYPGVMAPGTVEEIQGPGVDVKMGRISQSCDDIDPGKNQSYCENLSNGGFGPKATGYDGLVPQDLIPAWYWTNMFALEVAFHNRISNYKCRTLDPKSATAFYIPAYVGLGATKYLYGNYSASKRDEQFKRLLRWVTDQPSWKSSKGADHFIVLGRISWDFRRASDGKWGSSFLSMPPMRQTLRLAIERSPWDRYEVGLPYPTGFHPGSKSDLDKWLKFIRTRSRSTLFTFVGGKRTKFQDDFRTLLLDQCHTDSGSCKFVDCASTLNPCSDGNPAMLGAFLDSTFCLQPRGDSYTRKSTFDCMLAGSIPVFFWKRSIHGQYDWFLGDDPERFSVFIDERLVRNGTSIKKLLEGYGIEEIQMMRERISNLISRFLYTSPGDDGVENIRDAFDIAMEVVLRRFYELRVNQQ